MSSAFNPVFANLPTTIFEIMSRLAREHQAVNLGQGFPDDPGAEDIRAKAAEAVVSGWNQYPPMMGLPELRTAIAAHYGRHQNLMLDPDSEIMVTSGATEAIAGALFALIAPGDEVVLFEPMYDAYLPLVLRAGGVPKFVKLKPPHWRFTADDLMEAFSPRTKLVLFNNPLNPAGNVCPVEDLTMLAHFCMANDAIAVCDEVWEHVVFDGVRHQPLIALPGMRERTIFLHGFSKAFAMTGFRLGYACAPAPLTEAMMKIHQYSMLCASITGQQAAVEALRNGAPEVERMRQSYAQRRNLMLKRFADMGLPCFSPGGAFYMFPDIRKYGLSSKEFALRLLEEESVAVVPGSAFGPAGEGSVRACYATAYDKIEIAMDRMEAFVKRLG